jgi:hypothetical protein
LTLNISAAIAETTGAANDVPLSTAQLPLVNATGMTNGAATSTQPAPWFESPWTCPSGVTPATRIASGFAEASGFDEGSPVPTPSLFAPLPAPMTTRIPRPVAFRIAASCPGLGALFAGSYSERLITRTPGVAAAAALIPCSSA